jgi:hypothetical protein
MLSGEVEGARKTLGDIEIGRNRYTDSQLATFWRIIAARRSASAINSKT